MTKPWRDYKDEIIRLYIQEGMTLQDVREILRRDHNFEASTRSYRQHFDLWNVGKYNCKRRQERRESFLKPNLPSPPGTPMLAPRLKSSESGGAPESVPALQPSSTARPGVDGAYATKQEPLPVNDIRNIPLPYRNSALQEYAKMDGVDNQVHRTKERAALGMECWNTGDRSPNDWAQRRAYVKKGPMGDISRCSPEQAHFNASTGQLSPIYLDHHHKAQMFDGMDWSMSKSGATFHHTTLSPALHPIQTHEHDRKPMIHHANRAAFGQDAARSSRPRTLGADADSALELREQRHSIARTAGSRMTSSQMEFA